ncbi:MAG: hypothetical protein IJH87_05540, partial [Atopobiaceae bacterium]|nr:hypothetical protein [Atopobiaceae bacterium]
MAAVLASTMLVLSLCACSGSQKPSSSDAAPSQEQAPAESAIRDLEIVEAGDGVGESGYLHYAICIHNPNETKSAMFPVVHVTCKDSEGTLISSDDWTLGEIRPGETAYYATQAGNGNITSDAEVSFTVTMREENWLDSKPLPDDPYVIDGLNVVESYGMYSFLGEITLNEGGEDYDSPMLVLVLRDADGNIVYGTST